MMEQDLIRLYQDLTASGEMLARSVAIFVESGLPLAAPTDATEEPVPPPREGVSPERSSVPTRAEDQG
jgi:hypothetical protein